MVIDSVTFMGVLLHCILIYASTNYIFYHCYCFCLGPYGKWILHYSHSCNVRFVVLLCLCELLCSCVCFIDSQHNTCTYIMLLFPLHVFSLLNHGWNGASMYISYWSKMQILQWNFWVWFKWPCSVFLFKDFGKLLIS